MDMDNGQEDFFEIVYADGTSSVQTIPGLRDNSVQTETFDNIGNVKSVNINVAHSAGVRSISFVPGIDCVIPASTLAPTRPTIVNGERAGEKEFPFFLNWGGQCGGTLIHEDIVLTAAHCKEVLSNDVYVGSYYRDVTIATDMTEHLQVQTGERHPHPQYNSTSIGDHDIMVLKLNATSSIRPVQLNRFPEVPHSSDPLVAVGHGCVEVIEVGDPIVCSYEDVLVEADDFYEYSCLSDDSQMCANRHVTGLICNGDSGGPLLRWTGTDYVQVVVSSQVVSPTIEYHCVRGFGAFARISALKEWIDEQVCNLARNLPSRCFCWKSPEERSQIGPAIVGEKSDQFGYSVVMGCYRSCYVAVSAPESKGRRGSVSIYEYAVDQDEWRQIGQDIVGDELNDLFGTSVALSYNGAVLVVGTPFRAGKNGRSGHIKVYSRRGGGWIQSGKTIEGDSEGDQFRFSVALSWNFIVVGEIFHKNYVNGAFHSTGRVRVYDLQSCESSSGCPEPELLTPDLGVRQFGWSISAVNKGKIAPGYPFNTLDMVAIGTRSNIVQVYQHSEEAWAQMGTDIVGERGSDVGWSVSQAGRNNILAFGARRLGYIRVYEYMDVYKGQSWKDWVNIAPDIKGPAATFNFGHSIALSQEGDVLAVGADPEGLSSIAWKETTGGL